MSATWTQWTGALKEANRPRRQGLFMPLRLALTGRDHGPELAGSCRSSGGTGPGAAGSMILVGFFQETQPGPTK